MVAVSPYRRIAVSLYRCIAVSLYRCITVSLYHCIPLRLRASAINFPGPSVRHANGIIAKSRAKFALSSALLSTAHQRCDNSRSDRLAGMLGEILQLIAQSLPKSQLPQWVQGQTSVHHVFEMASTSVNSPASFPNNRQIVSGDILVFRQTAGLPMAELPFVVQRAADQSAQ
jgi:hypothetical protein